MYTSTFCSERLYEATLEPAIVAKIDDTILKYNIAKYSAYNLVFFKKTNPVAFAAKYGDKSVHMIIKERFNLDTYYTNSAVQEATGIYASQVKKQKLDDKNKLEKIKAVEKKIQKEKKDLEKYLLLRENLHEYQKSDRTKKLKTGFSHISVQGNFAETRYFDGKQCIKTNYTLYQFEYEYLNPKIKALRKTINQRQFKVDNLKASLNKPLKHVVFAKGFDSADKLSNKYKEFTVSGRHDAGSGNFIFKTVPTKLGFDIWVKFLDGKEYSFRNVKFPYRGHYLRIVLSSPTIKIPICYTIVRKTDERGNVYYQFKVAIDISADTQIVTSKKAGMIGVDFNIGHIDITNIDQYGNIKETKTIRYEVTNDKHKNEASLRKAITEVAEYAYSHKKSLSVEDLDTSASKAKSTYRDKRINKAFHDFAYSRYNQYIDYACATYGIEVVKVNPAFTSYIGKTKYGYRYLNGHVLASYVIARRGLGLKEIVPKKLKQKVKPENIKKHHWSQWADLKRQKI